MFNCVLLTEGVDASIKDKMLETPLKDEANKRALYLLDSYIDRLSGERFLYRTSSGKIGDLLAMADHINDMDDSFRELFSDHATPALKELVRPLCDKCPRNNCRTKTQS